MQAFGGMFCLSGLLGMYGSCATLAGYCMSRHFGIAGMDVFKLKVLCRSCSNLCFDVYVLLCDCLSVAVKVPAAFVLVALYQIALFMVNGALNSAQA